MTALVLALGIWFFSPSSAKALGDGQRDGEPNGTPLAITGIPVARESVGAYRPVIWAPYSLTGAAVPAWINEQLVACRPGTRGGWGFGSLGYGGGIVPGYYGFGLGFHLGYGYGGSGLGVGAEGGYPYYGGPGYRCGGLPYDGGPAYSGVANALIRPDYPYGGLDSPADANAGMGAGERARAALLVGPGNPYYGYDSGEGTRMPPPLGDYPGYRGGFGPFTGASPYPYTHPSYTAEAAATGSVFDPFSNVGASEGLPPRGGAAPGPVVVPPRGTGPPPPATTAPSPPPALGFGSPSAHITPAPGGARLSPVTARDLGIDEEPVVGTDAVRSIQIAKVYPGTAAEKAGLQAGDVIHSINGYLTEQPGNLAWIISRAAPDQVPKLSVRKVGDGQRHTITVRLPSEPVGTARPPYLPPVSPGPPPATR